MRTVEEVYGIAFAEEEDFESALDHSLAPRGFDLLFDLVAGLGLPPGSTQPKPPNVCAGPVPEPPPARWIEPLRMCAARSAGGPDGADRQGGDPVAEGECVRAGVKDHTADEPVAELVAHPGQVPGVGGRD
jgi:hypothetical protein